MANSEFTKMMLVPEVPKALSLKKQMNTVVNLKNKSDDEKVREIRQLLMTYLNHFKSLRGQPSLGGEPSSAGQRQQQTMHTRDASYLEDEPLAYGDFLPGRASTPIQEEEMRHPEANRLTAINVDNMVTALTERPDVMRFNDNGELVYHGITLPNSNVVDLMAGVGADRDIFNAGINEVLQSTTTHGRSQVRNMSESSEDWPQPLTAIRRGPPVFDRNNDTVSDTANEVTTREPTAGIDKYKNLLPRRLRGIEGRKKAAKARAMAMRSADRANMRRTIQHQPYENASVIDVEAENHITAEPQVSRDVQDDMKENRLQTIIDRMKTRREMGKRNLRMRTAQTRKMKARSNRAKQVIVDMKRKLRKRQFGIDIARTGPKVKIPKIDQEQLEAIERKDRLLNLIERMKNKRKLVTRTKSNRQTRQLKERSERAKQALIDMKRRARKRKVKVEIARLGPKQKRFKINGNQSLITKNYLKHINDTSRAKLKRQYGEEIKRRGKAAKIKRLNNSKVEEQARRSFAQLLRKARK